MPTPRDFSKREITDVATLLSVIDELTKQGLALQEPIWWRGQKEDWSLRAKVFRREHPQGYEPNVYHSFMQRAQTRHVRCPRPDAHDEWLFFMQHYGVPTRLLDWTESPLNALYFAVVDDKESNGKPGSVWALNPFMLNATYLQDPAGLSLQPSDLALLHPQEPIAARLIENGFDFPGGAHEDVALARITAEVDPRLMVQQAGMTVHGSEKPLDDFAALQLSLFGYVVPAEKKKSIREELERLGIRERALFPDLEHLASDLAHQYDFNPTVPPPEATPPPAAP